jgi:hypothetical protein
MHYLGRQVPLKRQYCYSGGDKVAYLMLEDSGGLIVVKGGVDLIGEEGLIGE